MVKGKVILTGIAFIGGGGGALGTVLIIKTPGEPDLNLLVFDDDYSSDYEANTIGKTHGWYLVGVYGNEEWWKSSYERLKNANQTGITNNSFHSEVTSAFSPKESTGEESDKALNRVCKKIYKKKEVDNTKAEDHDLLKYCSPLKEKPKELYDTDEQKTDNSWYYAISTKYSGNILFWELRDFEFFGKEGETGTGSGLDSSKDPLFHNLYSSKKGSVKSVCEEIYSLKKNSSSENEKFQKDTFEKFCFWKELPIPSSK